MQPFGCRSSGEEKEECRMKKDRGYAQGIVGVRAAYDAAGKPLKRLGMRGRLFTGLKPGANERKSNSGLEPPCPFCCLGIRCRYDRSLPIRCIGPSPLFVICASGTKREIGQRVFILPSRTGWIF